ncbi:MAG: ABC transporter permease subunit [Terricaulis sp.]
MSELYHARLRLPFLTVMLRPLFAVIAAATLLPVGYAVLWSGFGTGTPGLLSSEPSLRWYQAFLASEEWRAATWSSVSFALVAALLAALTGVLVSYTSRLDDGRLRSIYAFIALLTSAFPMLLFALALRVSASRAGFDPTLSVIIGQWAIIFPFTYFIFEAASDAAARPALWSSFVLGVSVSNTLYRIYLPLIASALAATAAIAFLTSWDDAIMPVVIFDTAPETLSKRLWNLLNSDLYPYPAVVGTLFYVLFPGTLMLTLLLVRRLMRAGSVRARQSS